MNAHRFNKWKVDEVEWERAARRLCPFQRMERDRQTWERRQRGWR